MHNIGKLLHYTREYGGLVVCKQVCVTASSSLSLSFYLHVLSSLPSLPPISLLSSFSSSLCSPPPSHLPLCSFSSPPSQNVSVTFVSNTAGHAGAAIYAADISGCTFTNMECKPTINYNTTYQRSIFVQSPFTFKLVKPLRKDNCIGICTH